MNKSLKLVLQAGLSAFVIYFCMYAFRKPFAAASFSGWKFLGFDLKIVLVISQVFGYALSKFIGIGFNSGPGMRHRAWYIILFVSLAETALLGFALAPIGWKPLFLFLNGLPLGMIWGLVFAYLEGRTITEVLAAILSASFILASGMTKSVGKFLMNEYAVSEFWMPFWTGALFYLPLLAAVWVIDRVPEPSDTDRQHRKERLPMSNADRWEMFAGLAPGLLVLILLLFLMTAFRDLRDNFSAEFWEHLGHGDSAAVFTQTEIGITVAVLLMLGLFVFIKDSTRAFAVMKLTMLFGLLLMLASTLAYRYTTFNSPLAWMTLSGTGVYLAYTTLSGGFMFERISAVFNYRSNAGFLIYVADAVGYLGSVLILVSKEVFYPEVSFFEYFIQMIYVLGTVGLACVIFSYFYFQKKAYAAKEYHR